MAGTSLRISVVIPAHNEAASIEKCVKSVLEQDYPNREVIVVNDGSMDRTSDIAKSLQVRVIDFKEGHSAAFARNAGAKEATGGILYFLDGDAFLADRTYLSKMADDFNEADAVGVRAVPDKPSTFIQACLGVVYSQVGYVMEKRIIANAPESDQARGFWAVRRDVFQRLGGFDEKIFYYEDRDLHNRFFAAGYKTLYDPRLVIHSIDPKNWGEFIRQSSWNGRGLYEYYSRTGILHVRAFLLWGAYVASGIMGLLFLPSLPVFVLMNLAVLGFIAKTAMRSNDLVHSAGFVFLHFVRTVVVAFQFASSYLSEGGRKA
ncbi:MAG: glycosyltransferase [Candidatus Altiarchaeota archaeon]|nr:glycosyltransferase [Candidatus Altiarchaeota archaeon]